jgi:preprotein translocase subunit Sss1
MKIKIIIALCVIGIIGFVILVVIQNIQQAKGSR